MELTEKNGHASIEEILASVRRIIAEEPGHSGASGAPVIDFGKPMQYPRGDGLLDDPSDFDLPSIFKTQPAAPAADKPAPLFGRLSEAIRAASATGQNGDRDAPSAQSLSSLKLHRVETDDAATAPHFLLSTFHEATAPRVEDLAASADPSTAPGGASPVIASHCEPQSPPASASSDTVSTPAAAPAVVTPQVPRQMAAFKDTRFRGMGTSPAPISPSLAAVSPFEAAATQALVEAASAAAEPAVSAATNATPHAELAAAEDVLATVDVMTDAAPTDLTAAIMASYPSIALEPVTAMPEADRSAATVPALHVPPPVPSLPPAAEAPAQPSVATAAPIEDSTADLLRPMLRQWLAENMPRMVEKALHIEVAESVKSTKK